MNQVLATGESITLVHFVHLAVGLSESADWRIACMPNMIEFHATSYHPNYQRTDDVRAVTCPECKKSSIFKKSQEILKAVIERSIRVT